MKVLLGLLILTLPYTNFPLGVSATRSPMAILLLPLVSLVLFLGYLRRSNFKIYLRSLDFAFDSKMLFYYVATVIGLLILLFNGNLSKNISPITRFIQFNLYFFIQVSAYYAGKYIAKNYETKAFFNLLVISFLPSIVIGILQIVTANAGIIKDIRSLVTSTDFPVGYYRVTMLTTEPSFAAFDIAGVLLPIGLFFFTIGKRAYGGTLIIVCLILLMFTQSIVGIIMLVSLFIIIMTMIKKYRLLSVSIAVLGIVLAVSVNPVSLERIGTIMLVVSEGDYLIEESSATRLVSYLASINVWLENPVIGVGFRNLGYYYADSIPDEFLSYPSVKDWADYYSSRFAEDNSYILGILSSSGIIGAILSYRFFSKLIRCSSSIKTVKSEERIFLIMILLGLLGSFAINIFGLPTYWILIGYVSGYIQIKEYAQYDKKDNQ